MGKMIDIEKVKTWLSDNFYTCVHNGEAYCEYGGKKIAPDCESDHYEVTEYYHCDCDDAIKQMDIEDKIKEIYRTQIVPLQNSLPEAKYALKSKTVFEISKIK